MRAAAASPWFESVPMKEDVPQPDFVTAIVPLMPLRLGITNVILSPTTLGAFDANANVRAMAVPAVVALSRLKT